MKRPDEFRGKTVWESDMQLLCRKGKEVGRRKGRGRVCSFGEKERMGGKKKKKSRRRKKVKGINNHWPVCIETSSDLLFCCVWGPWKDSSKRATASPKTKQTGEGGEIRTRHW